MIYILSDLPSQKTKLLQLSRDQEPEITVEPERLDRQKSPELSRESEQWVQHHIWRKYAPSIREGVLPNRLHKRKNGINRVDVMHFTGSMNPTEVYRNQDENDIIGIEAKSSNLDEEKIKTQLESYLNSGGLTELYLAVPESTESEASSILMRQSKVSSFGESSEEDSGGSITEVGLITVDTEGNVEVKKEASKQEILYDGLKVAEHGTNPMAIGWGKEPESPSDFDTVRPSSEFESWFSQSGYYD